MENIVVDKKELLLENKEALMEINNDSSIEIKGNVKLLIKKLDYNLNIKLGEYASLELDILSLKNSTISIVEFIILKSLQRTLIAFKRNFG